jgi:hypothetical protein
MFVNDVDLIVFFYIMVLLLLFTPKIITLKAFHNIIKKIDKRYDVIQYNISLDCV